MLSFELHQPDLVLLESNIYHTEGTYSVCVSSEVGAKVQHERMGILKYVKAVARRKPYFSTTGQQQNMITLLVFY